MTDERKKPEAQKNGEGYTVNVPDELLEEAVEAVDRRVSKSQVNTGVGVEEISVDLESSATEAEAPDIEKMSVDELLNSGFLPDKIVAAFLEERTKATEMKKQLDAAKEKIAGFLSESEAFRRRLTREKDDAIKFANEKVLKEFLPVIDNLERALAAGGDATAQSIREGVDITLRQANHVLEKLGVTRVAAGLGTPFDPRIHEAVSQQENKDLPPNSVAMVLQSGYLLHDRLLRPAMVAVAKGGVAASTAARAPAPPSPPPPPAAPTTAPEAAAPAPPAAGASPATAAETPEQRLERIRRAGQAAREARLKKKQEEQARAAADGGARQETPEEKAERLRRTGQAAREARLARSREKARQREAEEAAKRQEAETADAARAKETPEEKLARIRRVGQAAREAREAKRRERERGDAQSVAAAEAKEARKDVSGETPEQKLERIRRVGQAAREARRKKREAEEAKERAGDEQLAEEEAVAEAEAQEAATTSVRTETPEEKLERIRRVGQAAREARRKKREQGQSAAKPANPLAGPAFEDDDLESWESTVDSIRTDKS